MAKPTLFISHSTNKPDSSTRTLAVRQALEVLLADQWHVFVDSERIEPGDAWRTSVLYHLAIAAGAIILFDDAALESGWVESEAQILSFRRSIYPGFPLVPVLFAGLKPEDDYFKQYQPFQLNEVQALKDNDDQESPEDLARRIANEFAAPGEAVTNYWMDAVCGYLEDVREAPLQLAATALNFKEDVLGVLPKEKAVEGLRRAVAQTMHWKPVLEATKALNPLITHRAVDVEIASGLCECLRAKWVENEVMEVLICASRSPSTFGTLTLDTKRQDIVDHYLSRARFELEPDAVFAFSVGAADGEDEKTILPQVRDAIEHEIVPEGYWDAETGDRLELENAVEEKLANIKASAFCVLPESCVKGNVLSTLRRDFPRVTFIVRVEGRLLDYPLPDTKPLDPPNPAALNVLSELSSKLENLLKVLIKKR
jgi:TIR domain